MGSTTKSRNFNILKRRHNRDRLTNNSEFAAQQLTDSPYGFFSPTLDPTLVEDKRYDTTLSYLWNRNAFIRAAEGQYIELIINHAQGIPC